MKTLITLISICLLWALPAGAFPPGFVAGMGGAAADPYSFITFFWRMETTTLETGDYWGAGDNTAAAIGAISLSPTAALYGSNGALTVDGFDFYSFGFTDGVEMSDDSRVGTGYHVVGTTDSARLWAVTIGGTELQLYHVATTNKLQLAGGAILFVSTGTVAIDEDRYIEVELDPVAHTAEFFSDGVSIGKPTDADYVGGAVTTFKVGTANGNAKVEYLDNLIIVDHGNEVYNSGIYNDTSSPRVQP